MRIDHPVLDPGILQGLHLIEADAGTGKTWTLSGLVVRALLERALDIDRILVVTFTRAATAELIGRIRARIDQLRIALTGEGTSDDPFIAEYLRRIDEPAAALARVRRALACMDDAAVHTIHGFCQRVLAEHAMSTGVPLQTTLTAGDDELLLRVIGDWWRAQVIGGPAELVAFCAWHRLSPATVLPIVRRALQTPALEIRPRVEGWRARLTLPRRAIERLEPLWREQRQALRAWLGVKANVNGVSFKPVSVARWFDEVDAWLASSRVLGDRDPEGVRKLSREHFELRNKGRLPPGDLAQAFADVVEAYRLRDECVAALLADVIGHVRRDLPAARDASGVLEFDDLLLRMRDALADPLHGGRFATMLQERYPLVLIDECQDTDPLQWEVFRRVHFGGALSAAERGSEAGNAGAHGLIVVGDPKQSIYGFRGADVFSYLDARAQGGRQHRLTENQRSDPALIAAFNALFGRQRPFLVDEIGFSEASAADRPRARFEDAGGAGRAPMTLVAIGARDIGSAGSSVSESGADGAGADGSGKGKAMTVEQANAIAARACAREIARLLGPGGARIDGRGLRPSDIAVLVHRHAEGAAVKRALARLGIGAVELSRDSVFASRQADELLRVIGALAQPARIDLLRGALVTRLLGWNAGDLAGDAEGEERLAGAARAFAQAREHWFDAGPMAALRALVHRWNGFARLAGDEDGERVLTNVLHLLELLAGAQQARTGPQAALRWLSRGIERDDAGEAGELRLESDARLVNVMTIHRSKGLEYPVVLLPFAWTGRAHRRTSRPDSGILWHEHTAGEWRSVRGFGIPSGDAADSRAALEHHSETLRQLYVAVTRARHRCYLFWGVTRDSVRAPLAWLLHGIDPLDAAAAKSLSPEVVMPTLQAFAAPLPEACAVLEAATIARAPAGDGISEEASAIGAHPGGAYADGAHSDDASRPRAAANDGPVLAARAFGRAIPAPWQRRSFSSLLQSVRVTDDRPDHDEDVGPALVSSALPSVPPVRPADAVDAVDAIRFVFPAGPEAGNCLHAILEHSDFGAGVDPERVRVALLESGFVDVEAGPVTHWLSRVLACPLQAPGGERLRLSAVPRSDTVRELSFELRAGDADARRIVAAVARHYPLPFAAAAVTGARWRGYLRGFVDLVFRAGGRFYIVDWKSNHLGDRVEDYGPAALDAAMREHAYSLQLSLYTLALHRHLATRVPGYRYDTHFGGVLYLFLRGVHAPGVPADAPAATGVHATRPPLELVETLDALLPVAAGEGDS